MRLPSGVFARSYSQDMALVRTKTHWALMAVLLVFVFTVPQWASNSTLTLATIIGINIIAAHGLNILTGSCGLVSMGHSGFMMVGGYAMAIVCSKLNIPFILAVPISGLVAGLVGIVFGLPSLRIKGFYLIMATVAAFFIIHWLVLQFRGLTGGSEGMSVPTADFRVVHQTQGELLLRGHGHRCDRHVARQEPTPHSRRPSLHRHPR